MTRNDIREKASKWLGTISTPPSEKMYLKDYMLDGMESFGLEIARAVAEDCAKVVETEFAPAYVEQIFPEVSREYIKEHSSVITGASGRMGRHLCEAIPRKIREYAKRLEGEK